MFGRGRSVREKWRESDECVVHRGKMGRKGRGKKLKVGLTIFLTPNWREKGGEKFISCS